ncbi:MAG: glycosyltransferase family 39 protein [Deltaproteobacteria bacterium]|nr:glycosyltransferase family 39 protein [Deltaproteobacteria bacterium]
MANIPKWVWIVVIGAVLTLPGLGSFGLWDPVEIRQADLARELVDGPAEKGAEKQATHRGKKRKGRAAKQMTQPPLQLWLVGLGFKVMGVNEIAGRLPLALCGILALLLAFRIVRRMVDEPSALAAAFVLGTTPTFVFQMRQLTSDVVFYTAILAAIGGVAAFLAPADGVRRRGDLIIGGVGLVAGFLSRGLLLGTIFPLLVLGLAVLMGRRYFGAAVTPKADEAAVTPKADEADEADEANEVPTPIAPFPALGGAAKSLGLALIAAGVVIGLILAVMANSKFMLIGSIYRKVAIPPVFTVVFRDIGFGMFPWVALAPLALWSFVAKQSDGEKDGSLARGGFLKLVLIVAVVLGFLLTVLWPGFFGKVRFLGLPFLALGIGVWAYEAFKRGERRPFWGVLAAGLVLVLQQDFFMRPESLTFSHLLQHAKYPEDLSIKVAVRLFGLLLALGFYLALAGPPEAFKGSMTRGWAWVRKAFNAVAEGLDFVGGLLRWAGGEERRRYWQGVACGGLIFTAWGSWWLTPQLSFHMSNKALFQTYHQCKQEGERLSQYRVSGRGASYYNHGQLDEVRQQADLFKLLQKPERAFVLIPATNLGAIDQSTRQRKITYHVLDDRNSHYLIISNKLAGKCNVDKNPLRKLVLSQRPNPKHKIEVNFEDKVKLIGYDVPDVVTRGSTFTIKLYFQVLKRLPANYGIFIHFDKPASRFHGDHKPLGGKYPTQYWLPGDYIVDPQKVELPLLTTSGGTYTMNMGFWQGSKRFKIIKGPNDGVNRAAIGRLRVR